MTTSMTITLLIIAAASIALNVFQYMERKMERKEFKQLIKRGAELEIELASLKDEYQNEVHHKEWAIGHIKDQQAVIDQLKMNIRPKRERKEAKDVR
jgi:seryl-tRNA(Sec) selenium transferase